MELILRMKMAYGITRFYPENETARKLLEFQERKTFNLQELSFLKEMGFRIMLVENESEKINEF